MSGDSFVDSFLHDADFRASGPCSTLKATALGFIDVGVRDGIHPVVAPVAGLTSVLAFEPDAAESERLRARYAGSSWRNVTIEPVGLAERAGTATLHVTAASTNSSLRPVHRPFVDRYRMDKFRPVSSEPVVTATLDDVLGRYGGAPGHGDFIKLDTQGTEYEILTGAARTLSERTVAVLVEVWYCQVYDGQRLFSDIEALLRSHGFSFYGAGMHYRSCKRLDKRRYLTRERPLWADAVFLKDPLAGGYVDVRLTERQAHLLFVCASLLEFYDFAYELACATWADGRERERLDRFIRHVSRLPAADTALSVLRLAADIVAAPGRANVAAGKFVDARRERCSYEDVA
jgi:FkbM family methyltransferase